MASAGAMNRASAAGGGDAALHEGYLLVAFVTVYAVVAAVFIPGASPAHLHRTTRCTLRTPSSRWSPAGPSPR